MTAMNSGMLTISGGGVMPDGVADMAAGNGPDTPFVSAAHDVSAASVACDAARFEQALTRERGAPHALRDGLRAGLRAGLHDAAAMLDRDWTAATGLAAASLHTGRWGPADMLALQGRMLQASLRMDLASKLVQKSTQAVDQLVRIQ
ncbi:MAG: type III secretion system inner rod subunit SctI [Janthinobacterium lividum]